MSKTSELRDLSVEENEELFNLRFQHATGQLENYRRLRELRRDIARLKTILREHELAEEDARFGGGGE